ncbi:hypothetical protein Tco_0976277 [Tanacetum coccineum]|uniref:Uncharacterized protein n=1 Tax=Tanacetum coccineum TaxID=301880 RepID=A0ABQ5EGV8_9ASTR
MGENVYIRDLIDFDVTISTSRGKLLDIKHRLVWFVKYYANVRRTVADFSHAPPNEYSLSPNDKKQWDVGLGGRKADSEIFAKKRTSKDNEDPGWNTSFKTRRTQKTTSAVEALWKDLYVVICLVRKNIVLVCTAKPTVSTVRRNELVLLSQQLVLLEENSLYCSRLQLPALNQSVNTARITAAGEKVNAAESLLVVSTEVNAN